MSAPLIVMPCSATKLATPGTIPALDRYDGPMWRTLRAAIAETDGVFKVWFLSARHGFHPASFPMLNYDERMTARRAHELLHCPTSNHHAFAAAVAEAPAVLLAGGELYRDTMRRALPTQGYKHPDLTETDGPGIGYQRAQLRAWIERMAR